MQGPAEQRPGDLRAGGGPIEAGQRLRRPVVGDPSGLGQRGVRPAGCPDGGEARTDHQLRGEQRGPGVALPRPGHQVVDYAHGAPSLSAAPAAGAGGPGSRRAVTRVRSVEMIARGGRLTDAPVQAQPQWSSAPPEEHAGARGPVWQSARTHLEGYEFARALPLEPAARGPQGASLYAREGPRPQLCDAWPPSTPGRCAPGAPTLRCSPASPRARLLAGVGRALRPPAAAPAGRARAAACSSGRRQDHGGGARAYSSPSRSVRAGGQAGPRARAESSLPGSQPQAG